MLVCDQVNRKMVTNLTESDRQCRFVYTLFSWIFFVFSSILHFIYQYQKFIIEKSKRYICGTTTHDARFYVFVYPCLCECVWLTFSFSMLSALKRKKNEYWNSKCWRTCSGNDFSFAVCVCCGYVYACIWPPKKIIMRIIK